MNVMMVIIVTMVKVVMMIKMIHTDNYASGVVSILVIMLTISVTIPCSKHICQSYTGKSMAS